MALLPIPTGPAAPAAREDPQFAAWTAWARRCIVAADLASLDQSPPPEPAPDGTTLAGRSRAVLLMVEARRAHREGEYARSRALLRRAEALLKPDGSAATGPTRWLVTWLHLWLGHHDYARGSFTSAARLYARTAAVFHETGDTRGASSAVRGLGNVAKYLGLYEQAAEHYDHAIELARACTDVVGVAAAEHNHGNVLLALGQLRPAGAAYRRAIRAFGRAGRADLVRHATINLATTEHERGRYHEALRLLAGAAPPASAARIHRGDEAERLIAVAQAEAALRRRESALGTLARAIVLASESGESHTEALARRTRAALLLEDAGRAREALAEARRGIRASDTAESPTEITGELHELAARAAGRTGAWRVAARHFRHAYETQKRFATRRNRERADTLALNRELARARHHAELARVENARLSEALAQIAARLEAEKSGHAPRPAGEVTPESLRGLGLRPRESEVLLWLIHGKSNVEIGTILGCSTETVKSHLKRIYVQLDVTNRTAAAASAVARAAAGTP